MTDTDLLLALPALTTYRTLPPEEFMARHEDLARVASRQQEREIEVLVPDLVLDEGEIAVPLSKMPALEKALAALARRAARLNLAPPTVTYLRVGSVPEIWAFRDWTQKAEPWTWTRSGNERALQILRPDRTPIRMAGWTFAATIQHLGPGENLLRISPSFEGALPTAFRTDGPSCDHCRTLRRRQETFVLRHDNGHFTRIGRNCLADYLGAANAEALVLAAALEEGLSACLAEGGYDEDGWGGGGGFTATSPVLFLSVVMLFLQTDGWCSRKTAREKDCQSTADRAWDLLHPPPGTRPPGPRLRDVTDAHRTQAAEALAWASSLDLETSSDYLYNLGLLARREAWTSNQIGLGAAMAMSYAKEVERRIRLAHEQAFPSTFFGEIKTRYGGTKKGALPPIRARVLRVYPYEGMHGLVTIVSMQTPAKDGGVHDLVWFASGDAPIIPAQPSTTGTYPSVKPGQVVDIVGTVKAHTLAKGTERPQTVLSRCALYEVIEEPEAETIAGEEGDRAEV